MLSELRLHDAAARALEAALKAPALSASERRDYEARLREARAEAQKRAGPRLMGSGGGPRQPDHYKLLSLQRSCTMDEVGTPGGGGCVRMAMSRCKTLQISFYFGYNGA